MPTLASASLIRPRAATTRPLAALLVRITWAAGAALLLAAGTLRAQEDPASGQAPDADAAVTAAGPEEDPEESDWSATFGDSRFTSPEFRQLRRYRDAKRTEVRLLEPELLRAKHAQDEAHSELARAEYWSAVLNRNIKPDADDTTGIIIEESLPNEYDDVLGIFTPGQATVGEVRRLMRYLGERKESASRADSEVLALQTRIHVLRDDLERSEDAIDTALRSENREMLFKTLITAFFSLLIGVMIYRFFQTIRESTGAKVGELLLSDSGLQFVTIFVLIIAIILFGILNILEGRELAAILSGIAGYILGRGASLTTASGGASDPRSIPNPPAESVSDRPRRSPVIQTAHAVIPPPAPPADASTAAKADQGRADDDEATAPLAAPSGSTGGAAG
jgi:hypothetical protein